MAAPLTVWVWRGVLLQDLDAVPSLHSIEMVPQSVSGTEQPWVP